MAHEGYHEPYDTLPEAVRTMHRALESLIEELEAVDWYYQRAAVTEDADLREILLHNAHEEIEHACMALEWIRRHDTKFDANLREYLFRAGSIVGAEAAVTGRNAEAGRAGGAAHEDVARTRADGPPPPAAVARRSLRVTVGSMRGGEGGER